MGRSLIIVKLEFEPMGAVALRNPVPKWIRDKHDCHTLAGLPPHPCRPLPTPLPECAQWSCRNPWSSTGEKKPNTKW